MADAHIGLAGLCRLAQLGDGLGELRHGPPPGDLAALGQRRIYTALCLQRLDQQGPPLQQQMAKIVPLGLFQLDQQLQQLQPVPQGKCFGKCQRLGRECGLILQQRLRLFSGD